MNYLVSILVLFLFVTCSQRSQSKRIEDQKKPEEIAYVDNPKSNDLLCREEIDRAKKDVDQGKIVFTQNAGFLYGFLRYENELEELCKQEGLVFEYDMFDCVIEEDQTKGCYGFYMDKIICERYGADFKDKLNKKADSLFLARIIAENKVVSQYDCDEEAVLSGKTKDLSDFLPYIEITEPDIKQKKGEYADEGWPFFDLGFIVEKDSSISGFHSNGFVEILDVNEMHKNELYSIAVEYVKKNYPTWVPGKINGIPVRTDHNVRLFIKKKE